MDLANINLFWFLAISKKTKKIIKYTVVRGDKTYLSGKKKYLERQSLWKIRNEN